MVLDKAVQKEKLLEKEMTKQLSWSLICPYCGHENYAVVPQPSKHGRMTADCDNCGAYLITFEMLNYEEEG